MPVGRSTHSVFGSTVGTEERLWVRCGPRLTTVKMGDVYIFEVRRRYRGRFQRKYV